MKKWTIILLIGLLCTSMTCFLASGCFNPPTGTVLIDTNGDGIGDALAIDADEDGEPDLDEDGNPLIVEDSKKWYAAGEAADAIGPALLTTIGGLLGVPLLIGVGAVWKGTKWGRIVANTVMSVQAAREALSKRGKTGAEYLKVVDDALFEAQKQYPKTKAAIKKIKDKLDLHLDE